MVEIIWVTICRLMSLINGPQLESISVFPIVTATTCLIPSLALIKNADNLQHLRGSLRRIWHRWGYVFTEANNFLTNSKKQLFVAEHGSWNRSEPQGYRVALVKFNQGKPISEQVFIDGWLTKDGEALGRPVDILEMPDGSLLISDDKLGVIYKVEYKGSHG
jgi:Glucose/sorbosone dehydrogenases